MDITVNPTDNIKWNNNILINKLSISLISIDPLKRIANFTVSYWNDTLFLGQESYTYKATYIEQIPDPQPLLKSISMFSTTSYTITINATIGGIQYTQYTPFTFTSPFPYLTSLTIYYSQFDPSIISLTQSNDSYDSVTPTRTNGVNSYTYLSSVNGTFTSFNNYGSSPGNAPYLSIDASYAAADSDNAKINVFYTVNNIKYIVKINQPTPSLPCHGGIKTLYTNYNKSLLSVTTDSNYNIPLTIGSSDTLNVQSVPNVSYSTQTNTYIGYTNSIYTPVSNIIIYYNPNKISDISLSSVGSYIQTTANFTSVHLQDNTTPPTYTFSNLSYSVGDKSITILNITLPVPSQTSLSPLIYRNPLNKQDIGFQDGSANYDNLISLISSTVNDKLTVLYNLIKTFQTTKTITSVTQNNLTGVLSI
jgi:hypothetical protein